jgi:DNA-binding LacI/PurR family transcriptional regulator
MCRVTQPGKRLTLAVLAEAVGVSAATASNAFNHPERLSAALRTTILATADKLGYSGPDPRAAGLRRGRTGAIGVIVPDRLSYAFSDPAVVSVLDGLAEALDAANISLLLLTGSTTSRGPAVAAIQSASVDGFVMYGGMEEPDLAAALQRRRLPLVAIGGSSRRGRSYGDLDEEGGSRQLVEHLLGLGHRRFGIVTLRTRNDDISGPLVDERRRTITFPTPRRRLEAALGELDAAGIVDVPVFEAAHHHPDEAAVAIEWLVSQANRPTAIICQSDQLAIGAIEAVTDHGLVVPDDIAIGGFDDIAVARRIHPPLTTVRQPLQARGRLAGDMMLRILDGQRVRSSTMPTQLIVRESTGPVKRSRR